MTGMATDDDILALKFSAKDNWYRPLIARIEHEVAERKRLKRLLSIVRDGCVTCGVESCRHEGADHEFYQPADHIERLEAENKELREACERKNRDGAAAYEWGFDEKRKVERLEAENKELADCLLACDGVGMSQEWLEQRREVLKLAERQGGA